MDIQQFIVLPTIEYLNCFEVPTVMKKTVLNIHVQALQILNIYLLF